MGNLPAALSDVSKAVELGTLFRKDRDLYHQRGVILMRLGERP
jgi:hypothetical protein